MSSSEFLLARSSTDWLHLILDRLLPAAVAGGDFAAAAADGGAGAVVVAAAVAGDDGGRRQFVPAIGHLFAA